MCSGCRVAEEADAADDMTFCARSRERDLDRDRDGFGEGVGGSS